MPLLLSDIKQYAPTLPPQVAEAQINQESGFNPSATSSAGAQGIAQFIPSTFAEYGQGSPYNPQDALTAYAKYMGALLRGSGGNIARALSSYNSGNPSAYLDPTFAGGQTYNYVKNILGAAHTPLPQVTAATAVGQPAPAQPMTPAPLAGPKGPAFNAQQLGAVVRLLLSR